jgi:hypothetical protein
MRNILIGLSIVFIALFNGCSSSGSSSSSGGLDFNDDDNPTGGATTMTLSSAYVMATGAVITKTSTDAEVTIDTDVATNVTTATLTSGSATCTDCTKQ